MTDLQREIVNEMKVEPVIDATQEIRRRVDFLKDYLIRHPFLKGYVLGISGGQDSTLAGKLAQLAVNELGDDYQFVAVRLPYGMQGDEVDCQEALRFITPSSALTINIKPAVDAMVETVETEKGSKISDFDKGNIKARQRMVAQYAIGASKSLAVIGTDHSAEAVTGFFTKYGDGGADVCPLFGLNKRQGKALLAELGCPEHLYQKTPTADLEEERPALADEVALGVTYVEIDDYLEGKTISLESSEKIESWYLRTKHKRNLPVTLFDTWWK
jgi:NAD+ synthase